MAYRTPRAGELRDSLRFDRRASVSDGMGGALDDSWTPILTGVAAKIVARKGGEEVRSQRLSGIAPFDISVRHCEATVAISAGDRCVNESTGQSYDIKWVGSLDEGRSRFVTLDCQAGGVIDG
jgi:head-tail adaptor